MRPGVDSSSEVELGISVFNWIFAVALVEGTITVDEYCFGPVGEYVVGWFIGKHSFEYVLGGPVQTASQLGFAPLIATFQGAAKGGLSA